MIIEVWQRVMNLAKTGTSGQDTQDEFNGKINSAQKILEEMLIDVAEVNQKASDALNWLKSDSGILTSGANGSLTVPSDYLHMDSMNLLVSGVPVASVSKLETKSIGMAVSSPIRKPNITTNDVNVYFKTGGIFLLPAQSGITVDMLYYKVVPDASIVLTPVQDDDSDLVEPTVGVDLGWPTSVQNLLVYLTLEQLGIELKEEWLLEYSQFGISRDMIKTTPQ